MPDYATYIQQLTHQLSQLNPHLVILFGSCAYGKPHKDSDIDLFVVTKDEFVPKTFKERTNLYISVSEHILNISQQVPVELIVYTLPMYRQFVEVQNSFAREILTNGVVLYETNNKIAA